jgi:hypothetical protein
MFILALTIAAAIVLTFVLFAMMTKVDWLGVSGGMVHFSVAVLVLILIGAIVLAVWFGFIAALGWLMLNHPALSGWVCALIFVVAVIRQIRKFSSRRRLSSHYTHH